MKKIRTIAVKYQIPSIMGIMLLLFSCTKDDTLREDKVINKDNTKTLLTDEDVFKGVMFLEGPVADKLSDFKDLNFRSFVTDNSQIEEIINFQNEIINKIKLSDPAYLSDFRKKIGSGDYYLIKSTIAETSNKISNISYDLSNLDKNEVSKAAKKFTSTLEHKYHVDENSSKEDLIKALKDIRSEKQTSKNNLMPDYYYKWAAVWIAAAAVIVIVIFLEEAPMDPIDPLEPIPENPNKKRYLIDDYQSEITFELMNI